LAQDALGTGLDTPYQTGYGEENGMDGGANLRSGPRTIIVGAGAAGMALAIFLRRAGLHDLVIYEKANEVGGTWRENRYPGVACDVPSHHYNFSFEHNPVWSARLAGGAELQQYMLKVCEKYDLRRNIVFGQEIKEARFDGSRWDVTTDKGRTDSADFLVAATGPLHVPAMPSIPGLDTFKGEAFHTARWPYQLDLKGKRVGVIGTGSTGTQVISSLAEQGVDLTVFMRSPQWVFPLFNRRYGPMERALVRRVPWLGKKAGSFFRWFFEHVFAEAVIRPGWQRKFFTGGCRWNLKRIKDPELRKKLTPDFQPMCKRLVMSVDFYPAMQKPNVKLVREGIERVEGDAVIDIAGSRHALDVLVLATGFNTKAYFRPIQVINEQGEKLDDAWKDQKGAHLSTHVPGFPNFMILGGPQSPRGNFSAIAYSETIAEHIVDVIRTARDKGWRSIEARPDAMERFIKSNWDRLPNTIWITGCQSWYQDEKGIPETWTGTPDEFRETLRNWRAEDFVARPAQAPEATPS
jgi:cation diffusion facilitator CzcD-associated flavoprotein CzcO